MNAAITMQPRLAIREATGFCFVVLLAWWLTKIFRRGYLTPLRRIPGPWHARFTNIWLKKSVLSGQRIHYIHRLHAVYGPVVRIAPEEIAIADPLAFKEIHRIGSGFLKSPWYVSFRQGDTQDVFSMLDPRRHAERRKLFAPLFSNTSLRNNWHDVIVEKVTLAVGKMKAEAVKSNGEVDIFKWWTYMAADVTSRLAFGESFQMLEQERKPYIMQKIEDAGKIGLITSEVVLPLHLLGKVPIRAVRDTVNAGDSVQEYAERTVLKTRQNISRTNLFSKIIAEQEKDGPLNDHDVAFEAAGLIVAGSGTTAVTLTYLVWAVLSHSDVQRKLEAEVAALSPPYTDSELERLPYLSAVIEETLRLYGAAPGSLPRIVPKGGATLGGYYIPAGVTVSTQAFTLHRDKRIYPEPDRFLPERFISDSGEYQPPQGSFAPFGAGSRTCLGMHLALMELRHGAASFFRNFKDACISSSTTPASMNMANYFLISPAAQKCIISTH